MKKSKVTDYAALKNTRIAFLLQIAKGGSKMTWHNFQEQSVPYVVINSNIVSVRSEVKEPNIMFFRTFVILAIFACVYGSSFYNTGMYLPIQEAYNFSRINGDFASIEHLSDFREKNC